MIRRAIGRKILHFEQQLPQLSMLDSFEACGGKMWPAGDVLIKFLTKNSENMKNTKILELGSGCGYVGICVAAMEQVQKVTLTDRLITKGRMTYDMEGLLIEDEVQSPILLEIMKRNIITNSSLLNVQPDVQLLEWGAENEIHLEKIFQSNPLGNDYNLILGSDLTYHSSSAPKLFWTVSELLRRLSRRKEKCMHGESKERSDDVKFLTAHEHRLDHSTREVLKVAVDQYSLQHEELYRTPDKKHSIWQFTYTR